MVWLGIHSERVSPLMILENNLLDHDRYISEVKGERRIRHSFSLIVILSHWKPFKLIRDASNSSLDLIYVLDTNPLTV